MNEDEPRRSKGHCKQSGTGSWQSVITSGIFLSRCVQAHPVTHLYLYTESQDGPVPWPWAVPSPLLIARLIPVNRKQSADLSVKLSSCKSEYFFSWLKVHSIGSDRCGITASLRWKREPPADKMENLLSSCHCDVLAPWNLQCLHSSLFFTALSVRAVYSCHQLSIVIAQKPQWIIRLVYLWTAMNLSIGHSRHLLLSPLGLLSHMACPLKLLQFQYIWCTLFSIFSSPSGLPWHSFFQTSYQCKPIGLQLIL